MTASAIEASKKKDAFNDKTKELLAMSGGLPTNEKPLLLCQTLGKSHGIIKHIQMASTSPGIMFEDELNFMFKQNTPFRTDSDKRYSKVCPPWNDSLHCFWSMVRVVELPFHIPRFLTANDTFSCNIAATQEGFYPFLRRVVLLGEYQHSLKHRQFNLHHMQDFIFLNFRSTPQHVMHFRAYIWAQKGIKMASNEGDDASKYSVLIAISFDKKTLLIICMGEHASIFKRSGDPKYASVALM